MSDIFDEGIFDEAVVPDLPNPVTPERSVGEKGRRSEDDMRPVTPGRFVGDKDAQPLHKRVKVVDIESSGPVEVIPEVMDVTDMRLWRVPGSLAIVQSELLADSITNSFVRDVSMFATFLERNVAAENVQVAKNHVDKLVAYIESLSTSIRNLAQGAVLTNWHDALLSIARARRELTNSA